MALAAPPRQPRRLAFLGTPTVAVPTLSALVEGGYEIALVVSQPDRRRGRGGAATASPVKAAALAAGLAVTDRVADVADAGIDLGVVVAFGRIIPTALLEQIPMVNVHFSLLPRWRGAAPVERALLAGDDRTGVSVMAVVPELDAGDVYAQVETAIDPDDTATTLFDRLVPLGVDLLMSCLADGEWKASPQVGPVTYADKIGPEDRHIDWAAPASRIVATIRLGGAWTMMGDRRIKVNAGHVVEGVDAEPGTLVNHVVAAGEGAVRVLEVQPAGRGSVGFDDWLRGARLSENACFDG